MSTDNTIIISGCGVLAPTGLGRVQCFDALLAGRSALQIQNPWPLAVGTLPEEANDVLSAMRKDLPQGGRLDASAVMAAVAAQEAATEAKLQDTGDAGVILGSSRGATQAFEDHFTRFLQTGKTSPSMSPVTTGITLAATTANLLDCRGPVISQSAACQTALTSLATACAMMKSGMADSFFAGGAEACLTDFTISGLDRLGLLTHSKNKYPLRSGEPDRSGTVLSEGAAVFYLEEKHSALQRGATVLAEVADVSLASENASLTGVSETATGLQTCLRKIIDRHGLPDLVIGHLPATVSGDLAECHAYRTVLGKEVPITGLKWSVGHMLAASPGFSIAMALEMMRHGCVPAIPFATADSLLSKTAREPKHGPLKSVLICAMGFGGNAGAILLKAPVE